jgi:DNA-binding MarR family transcriptional regulator
MPSVAFTSLAALIPRLSRFVSLHLEHGDQPVSVSQFYVLQRIATGTTRAVDLAQRARVSGPTMSGIVDRLVQAGFVARESNADDRRVVEMSLTPAGRALLGERTSSLEASFSQLLHRATPQQLDELERTCDLLARSLDDRLRLPN